jgi:hypothetical protein
MAANTPAATVPAADRALTRAASSRNAMKRTKRMTRPTVHAV